MWFLHNMQQRNFVQEFDVQVIVHRASCIVTNSYNKTTKCTNFSNLFLV